MNIGNFLRRLREEKGYSQEYIAEQLEMSQNAYWKLENNQSSIKFRTIEKVAKVFKKDVCQFINDLYACDGGMGSRPGNCPGPECCSCQDATRKDQPLYEQLMRSHKQLLQSKDEQLVVQQRLLTKQEEEIVQLKAVIAVLNGKLCTNRREADLLPAAYAGLFL